jgi:hypothetical protein
MRRREDKQMGRINFPNLPHRMHPPLRKADRKNPRLLPSPLEKGDREAVDEERRRQEHEKYKISPYPLPTIIQKGVTSI